MKNFPKRHYVYIGTRLFSLPLQIEDTSSIPLSLHSKSGDRNRKLYSYSIRHSSAKLFARAHYHKDHSYRAVTGIFTCFTEALRTLVKRPYTTVVFLTYNVQLPTLALKTRL